MVEEDGELDVIISRESLEKEKRKLEELKKIAAESKSLSSSGKAGSGTKLAAQEAAQASKKQAKLVSDLNKKVRKLEKQQKDQDAKIQDIFKTAGRFVTDPLGAAADALTEVLQSTRAVPILGAAVGFGIAVFKIMEREFGDGGQFDLRVKVHDAVRSIVGLKQLVDIESGTVFMSPDTRLTTMAPETSNTESLRDGHVKYNQLTLGYR